MPASVSRSRLPSGLKLRNWLLSGWTLLVFIFLYVPIAVLVGYSFNSSRPIALAANESAMQKAFHEGDRVYCGLPIDDIVIVQADL